MLVLSLHNCPFEKQRAPSLLAQAGLTCRRELARYRKRPAILQLQRLMMAETRRKRKPRVRELWHFLGCRFRCNAADSKLCPLPRYGDGVAALGVRLDRRGTVVGEPVNIRTELEFGGHRLVPGDDLPGVGCRPAHDVGEIR